MTGRARKPAAFKIPPRKKTAERDSEPAAPPVKPQGKADLVSFEDDTDGTSAPRAPVPAPGGRLRGFAWGATLTSALLALLGLGAGLAATSIIEALFARHPWLGWAGLGLMGLAALSALVLTLRELAALIRQRRITRVKELIDNAHGSGDAGAARKAQDALAALYAGRDELAWPLQVLAEHDEDILDPPQRLALAERQLMSPLDREAGALIGAAARRVSVLTAISPSAIVDISFVAAVNLRLLRSLAELYGGRPGLIGLLRLARMVITHLTLTGGIALSEDLIQQLLGHSLASRISSRLGEGVLNGAMTARIGLAAMHVCRPMSFMANQPPGLKALIGALIPGRGGAREKKPEKP